MITLLTQHSDRACEPAYREKPRNAEKFFAWLFDCSDPRELADDLRRGREGRFKLLEYLGYHNNRTNNPHRFSVWGRRLLDLEAKYPDIKYVHLDESDLTLELREISTQGYTSLDYAASEEGFEWRMMEVDYYKLIHRRKLSKHRIYPEGLPSLFGNDQKGYVYRTYYTYSLQTPLPLIGLPRDIAHY